MGLRAPPRRSASDRCSRATRRPSAERRPAASRRGRTHGRRCRRPMWKPNSPTQSERSSLKNYAPRNPNSSRPAVRRARTQFHDGAVDPARDRTARRASSCRRPCCGIIRRSQRWRRISPKSCYHSKKYRSTTSTRCPAQQAASWMRCSTGSNRVPPPAPKPGSHDEQHSAEYPA